MAGLSLASSGCTGVASTLQANCATVNPCGGDISGKWRFVSSCQTAGCPGYTSDSSKLVTEFTFNSGMLSVSIVGTATFSLPLSCLQPDASYSFLRCPTTSASLNCTIQADQCSCNETANLLTGPTIGYTTQNGMLTLAGDPGLGAPYCIEGDRLRLSQFGGVPTAMAGYVSSAEYMRVH